MNQLRSAMFALLAFLSFVCALPVQEPVPVASGFRLQDGDVVVFYGDSITEQKLYTSDIENYCTHLERVGNKAKTAGPFGRYPLANHA